MWLCGYYVASQISAIDWIQDLSWLVTITVETLFKL